MGVGEIGVGSFVPRLSVYHPEPFGFAQGRPREGSLGSPELLPPARGIQGDHRFLFSSLFRHGETVRQSEEAEVQQAGISPWALLAGAIGVALLIFGRPLLRRLGSSRGVAEAEREVAAIVQRPVPAPFEVQEAALLLAKERLVTEPELGTDKTPIFVIRNLQDLELLSGVELKYMVVRTADGPGVLRVCPKGGGHVAMLHSLRNEPIMGAGRLLYDSTLKKMVIDGSSQGYPTWASKVTIPSESQEMARMLGKDTIAERSGLDVVIEVVKQILGPEVEIIRF